MEAFKLSWTVDIGQIAMALSFFVSAALFFLRLSDRLKTVEKEIKNQTDIIVNISKQQESIRYLEKRIDHIESGGLSRVA